jgi:hypothetical protein
MCKLICKLTVIALLGMAFIVPATSHAVWGDYVCSVTKVEYLPSGAVKVYLTRVSDSADFECFITSGVNEKLAIALTAVASTMNVMANFNDDHASPGIARFGLVGQ